MTHSTILAALLASSMYAPLLEALQQVDGPCQDLARRLKERLATFLANPATPVSFLDFENDLRNLFDESGRQILQLAVNLIEPEKADDAPKHSQLDNQDYSRKNQKTPVRNGIASTFGIINLERFSYEPLQEARWDEQKSFSPLEWNLGLVAGNATPALALRLGLLASEHSQQELLDLLVRDHHVDWSVSTLRKVTQAVSAGIEPYLQSARAKQLLAWLAEANQSRGRRKILLSVGRDGIMLPIRGESTYKEGGLATLAVFDRRGRRLGTVYLGTMPEAGQGRLTALLTELLTVVLKEWQGPKPRLAYVTDAGYHPENYYAEVLSKMEDPRHPGKLLEWVRIVDFYHAASYIGKLGNVLFNKEKEKRAWQHRMRHLLLKDKNGWSRVLHSAAYYHEKKKLSKKEEKEYQEAYGYLRRHGWGMKYAEYKRTGLPVGSGITEAGCKIVFTARFKRSGMKWEIAGGEVILCLRVASLSGVYTLAFRQFLADRPLVSMGTRFSSSGVNTLPPS